MINGTRSFYLWVALWILVFLFLLILMFNLTDNKIKWNLEYLFNECNKIDSSITKFSSDNDINFDKCSLTIYNNRKDQISQLWNFSNDILNIYSNKFNKIYEMKYKVDEMTNLDKEILNIIQNINQ